VPEGWTWLRQVHGSDVVVVDGPGDHAGAPADGAVTSRPGCALVVRTADCAPVVLAGERSIALLHLGWRGLVAGLVDAAVDAMAAAGDAPVAATVGPCIRPGCYEFDGPERHAVAARFGSGVLATTGWDTPALDLPEVVRAALGEHGLGPGRITDDAPCTACDRRWFSHRARGEPGRFATVAWVDGP
jgi:polyphenol oxidase